jgi:hypothetical protein
MLNPTLTYPFRGVLRLSTDAAQVYPPGNILRPFEVRVVLQLAF